MQYKINVGSAYTNGYDTGKREGYLIGFNEAKERSIELFCDNIVISMADEGMCEEEIQKYATKITQAVKYAWKYPEDWAIMRRQVFSQYDLHISYDGGEDA